MHLFDHKYNKTLGKNTLIKKKKKSFLFKLKCIPVTAELNLQQPVPRFLKNHLNMLIWWLVIINYYLHSYSHNTGFSLLTFKCCKVVTWILKCVSPRILLSQIWGTTFIDIKSHRVRSMHLHEVLINRKNFNNCLVPSGQNKTDLPCSQWSCWPGRRRTQSVNPPSFQTKTRQGCVIECYSYSMLSVKPCKINAVENTWIK